MNEALIVGLKIIAMFLVMSVGYVCYRKRVLDTQTTAVLAKLVTDITLPPLIFMQMVDTVDLKSLRVGWAIPLLAIAGACIGFVVGWATWRLFAKRVQAPVFIFASGISNWLYLAIPIVDAIYGKQGMQTLFLCNLGMQVLFWTLGVAILHGGKLDAKGLRNLATNAGLIATVAGIGFCVIYGMADQTLGRLATQQPIKGSIQIVVDGMRLLASATIPVSLLVTGAQIAAATLVQGRSRGANVGILMNRLFIAPVLCIAMLFGVHQLIPALGTSQLMVIAIVLLMPVSVTSTVLTEKMNQDTALAAQAVLYTTLASILTVPPMYMLARLALTPR